MSSASFLLSDARTRIWRTTVPEMRVKSLAARCGSASSFAQTSLARRSVANCALRISLPAGHWGDCAKIELPAGIRASAMVRGQRAGQKVYQSLGVHDFPFHAGNKKRYTIPVSQTLRFPTGEKLAAIAYVILTSCGK